MKKVSYILITAFLILFLVYPQYTKADESDGAGQKDAQAVNQVNATDAHIMIEKKQGQPGLHNTRREDFRRVLGRAHRKLLKPGLHVRII